MLPGLSPPFHQVCVFLQAALTDSCSFFGELWVGYCSGIDFISSISCWSAVIEASHYVI